MKNEKVYKSMSGTEVGNKLEKMMNLVDDMILDVGKYVSDIEHMTENFEKYLHDYGEGGVWTIEEFMAAIAQKTKKINKLLGIENNGE